MISPLGSASLGSLRPGELTIELFRDGDARIVLLRGELDLASAPALEEALRRVESGSGRLVVDLSELSFIDSTGIHLLLQAHLRTAGRLSLRPGPPEVQRVLSLTKVANRLSFEHVQLDAESGGKAFPDPSKPATGGLSAASPSG
jgi:anti-sigma B factor antagonist